MTFKTRREFLLHSGIALTGIAASPRLLLAAPPDPAPQKIRGLMVDAGRVPESLSYYRRVIDFCSEWELNTLHFRIADDQGTAMRFSSAPALLAHKNAFTPDQLHSLATYAQSHGVDLLPELESFGHTGYITRSPAYAHLLDQNAAGEAEFTGVIPVNPETLGLFRGLYREIASIFPSGYLHGGCDEVNWGGSALSRNALRTRTRPQIWADYLNSLNRAAQGLGKHFIVWADFVLHKEPEILGKLDKSIILMDWDYRENNSAQVQEAFLKARANGSRAIGAPGLIHYQWGARPGSEQLRNIDAFADAYLDTNDPSALGVVLTNWIPCRYIQNSIWDGFAYAAVAFAQGTATAQTSGFHRFVEKHYQAGWNETWDEAFRLIYDFAPYVQDRETSSWMGLRLLTPWSSDKELAAALQSPISLQNPFTRLRSLLSLLEPSVHRNLADFKAFALSAKYLEALYWRHSILGEHADPQAAAQLIQTIAHRDQELARDLNAEWDKGRPADSPAKSQPIFNLSPKDQMLYQWTQAAAYSTSLATHPDRFYQLITAFTKAS